MIYNYYVNLDSTRNPNYNHEVHKDGCIRMPSTEKRMYLGIFGRCEDALTAAKRIYPDADGCAICCPRCHRG